MKSQNLTVTVPNRHISKVPSMGCPFCLRCRQIEHLQNEKEGRKLHRRSLRDATNPFHLPDNEFQRIFRATKPMVDYLCQELEQELRPLNVNDGLPVVIKKMAPVIIVHGGAGDIPQNRVQGKIDGIKVAVKVGHKVLIKGGSALEAVEAAVISMEKDENFNAGYGSVLNLHGEVEMEASIMRGSDLNVGAVTLVKDFEHPISIAHKVLTDSPHSLLGAEGAKLFALKHGFQTVPPESLISPNAKIALEIFLKHGEFGRTEIGGMDEGGVGTVGAVAIDNNGRIAVATSTGGMSGKAVGRIGDTPQIGSGTYADDKIGGVSTTGHGESILKYCLAHSIIKLMERGVPAAEATKTAVEGMTARLKNTAGAITLSKDADIGFHFSSNRMAWAYIKNNVIFHGIDQGQILEERI